MEESVVKELLLVCTALGSIETIEEAGEGGRLVCVERFVRGENCLEWLQDLQRTLRRDIDATRDISIQLCKWKVPQTKLLPLLVECRDDTELVKTVAKICVMLSQSLSRSAEMALETPLILTPAAEKISEFTPKERKIRRENALAQRAALRSFKRAFASRPIMSVIVGALEGPMSRVVGTTRSDEDSFMIELMLTLLRNVLAVQDDTAAPAANFKNDHHALLAAMASEYIMDILLVLAQGIGERENAKWNLLLLDIMDTIIRGQDPVALATAVSNSGSSSSDGSIADAANRAYVSVLDTHAEPLKSSGDMPVSNGQSNGQTNAERVAELYARPRKGDKQSANGSFGSVSGSSRVPSSSGVSSNTGGQLRGLLAKEKLVRQALTDPKMQSRHSRFGCTLRIASAATTGPTRFAASPFVNLAEVVPQAARKKTKRTAAVMTADLEANAAAKSGSSNGTSTVRGGTEVAQARAALQAFTRSFLEVGYSPFMRSIKEELRRDTTRLQAEDKLMFFRLAAFFMSMHRHMWQDAKEYPLGQILETLDVMCFNLATNECDTALADKSQVGVDKLCGAVSLLKEMTHILGIINTSSVPTHQILALGLLSHVFLTRDSIDILPAVVRTCQPGKHPKRYLTAIAELIHVTYKVLEWRTQQDSIQTDKDAPADEALEVKRARHLAEEFDFNGYFMQMASNHTIKLYTTLLAGYSSNSPRTNHYILTYLKRLSKGRARGSGKSRSKSATSDNDEADAGPTLEPMLYNFHTLSVFAALLEDPVIRLAGSSSNGLRNGGQAAATAEIEGAPELRRLARYAAEVTRNFAELCKTNRLACVEALFQHAHPRSFIEELTGGYGASVFEKFIAAEEPTDNDMDDFGDDDDDDVIADVANASNSKSRSDRASKKARKSTSTTGQLPAAAASSSTANAAASDSEGEAEWGETSMIEAISKPDARCTGKSAAAKKKSSSKKKRKKQAVDSDDSDAEGAVDKNNSSSSDDGGSDDEGAAQSRAATKAAAKPKKRAPKWTAEEDAALREQYPLYADSASVFTVLAQDDTFEERGRTSQQIKRRATKLGLTGAAAAARSSQPPAKKQRTSTGASDSSDGGSESDTPAATVTVSTVVKPKKAAAPSSTVESPPAGRSSASTPGSDSSAADDGGSAAPKQQQQQKRLVRTGRRSSGGGASFGDSSSSDDSDNEETVPQIGLQAPAIRGSAVMAAGSDSEDEELIVSQKAVRGRRVLLQDSDSE